MYEINVDFSILNTAEYASVIEQQNISAYNQSKLSNVVLIANNWVN